MDILEASKLEFSSELNTMRDLIEQNRKKIPDASKFLLQQTFNTNKADQDQRMKNLEQQVDQMTRIKRKRTGAMSVCSRRTGRSLWRRANRSSRENSESLSDTFSKSSTRSFSYVTALNQKNFGQQVSRAASPALEKEASRGAMANDA